MTELCHARLLLLKYPFCFETCNKEKGGEKHNLAKKPQHTKDNSSGKNTNGDFREHISYQ